MSLVTGGALLAAGGSGFILAKIEDDWPWSKRGDECCKTGIRKLLFESYTQVSIVCINIGDRLFGCRIFSTHRKGGERRIIQLKE